MSVPLCRPTLGKPEEEALLSVLRSGHLVSGKWVAKFEEMLSERMGGKRVFAVANGTAALHVALMAAGVSQGDEVIVPALTYPAPVNVVELLGATPILVDIDPDTACMNPEHVSAAITSKTRALLPVHQFGIPADIARMKEVIGDRPIQLVEDAACALGSTTKEGPCGALGGLGCFSFHPRKIITTGEGGAVVTGDERFADSVDRLRNHGQTMVPDLSERFVSAGFNLRMSDLHGGVGVAQMERLETLIASRRHLARRYSERIAALKNVRMLSGLLNEGSVVQSLVIGLSEGMDRDRVFADLRGKGVETTIASYGIHRLPLWRERVKRENFPHANALHERGMTLPLFPSMSDEQVDYVMDVLEESVGR